MSELDEVLAAQSDTPDYHMTPEQVADRVQRLEAERGKKMDWSDVFRPAPGKIVVMVDEGEAKVGLLYVIRFREPCIGTVAAVYAPWVTSEGDEIEPHTYIGDRVMYGPNAGMKITIPIQDLRNPANTIQQDFRIMTEKEVLTWLKDPKLDQRQLDVE